MKIVIYYLGAALIVAFMTLQLHADEPASPILLMNKELEEEVVHRSPEQVPIECASLSSSILVTYLSALGSVSIELENLTTGEYDQTVVNALPGSSVLPFSGTSGTWTITFTLSSGIIYYGVFFVN